MSDAFPAMPLWRRFPAAHQFLRARLMDATFPIAPAATIRAQPAADEIWTVTLQCDKPAFRRDARFSAAELQQVYGPWAHWARNTAEALAELLPT